MQTSPDNGKTVEMIEFDCCNGRKMPYSYLISLIGRLLHELQFVRVMCFRGERLSQPIKIKRILCQIKNVYLFYCDKEMKCLVGA